MDGSGFKMRRSGPNMNGSRWELAEISRRGLKKVEINGSGWESVEVRFSIIQYAEYDPSCHSNLSFYNGSYILKFLLLCFSMYIDSKI